MNQPTDTDTTVEELKNLVRAFRDERDWKKHHTPKNLAMSIAIEAAELMEHFQWDSYSSKTKQDTASELADVLSYCLSLADVLDIDVSTAFRAKLAHNAEKYPVALFHEGRNSTKDYDRIKKSYRGKKDE